MRSAEVSTEGLYAGGNMTCFNPTEIEWNSIIFLDSGKVEKRDSWDLRRHSHEGVYELVYFIEAQASLNISGDIFHAGLYDFVVYPPGFEHQEILDPGMVKKSWFIRFKADKGILMEKPLVLKDRGLRVYWLCDQICMISPASKENCLSSELLRSHLKTLILTILELRFAQDNTDHEPDIANFCANHIITHFQEALHIGQLASLAYVSGSYLSRQFREKMGTTPMKYLNSIRMDNAKKLLCTSQESIGGIACRIGFNDPKHFSRLFKEATRLTPSGYRKAFSHNE